MDEVHRRLAGILAADVVGYSAMLGADESGTLARVRALRSDLIEPLAASHGGRLFKTTGDGFFAAFASAVQALRCAISIQEGLQAQADGLHLRIGVHQGEVVPEGNDLVGDGVIIAARIEPLAEPGGICISARVREDATGKMALELEDLGNQVLKNIAEPIRLYRVRIGAPKRAALPLPEKPSLAVLPFKNMSADPEQEYFAEGVVEDIVTALSRAGWLFVIARNSSFAYKDRSPDIRAVGRELGVRYVLEGSVRRAAGRVRITCQLIDAATARHVWADRFDGGMADIFDLQDRITERVVGAIEPGVQRAEIMRATAKPTESLNAYDLYLRSLPRFYANAKPDLDEAVALLCRALDIDPAYVRAKAFLAHVYCMRHTQGWQAPGESEGALALARETLASGTDDPDALRCAGLALAYIGGDYPAAFTALNRALLLHPNSAMVLVVLGQVHCMADDPEPAIDYFHRAMRASPLDPLIGHFLSGLGLAHILMGHTTEALPLLQRAVQETPTYIVGYRNLILALVRMGQFEEAREAATRMLKASPDYRIDAGANIGHAYRNKEYVAELRHALVISGIPEMT